MLYLQINISEFWLITSQLASLKHFTDNTYLWATKRACSTIKKLRFNFNHQIHLIRRGKPTRESLYLPLLPLELSWSYSYTMSSSMKSTGRMWYRWHSSSRWRWKVQWPWLFGCRWKSILGQHGAAWRQWSYRLIQNFKFS